jgi:transposase InsO family protein
MCEAHLRPHYAKRPVPRTTFAMPEHPVFCTQLAREFESQYPNAKWMVDITYIDTKQAWLYLSGVMDLYSRCILGTAMADHMTTELVDVRFEDGRRRATIGTRDLASL